MPEYIQYIHCIHCFNIFNFDYGEYLSKINWNTHLSSVVSLHLVYNLILNVNFS